MGWKDALMIDDGSTRLRQRIKPATPLMAKEKVKIIATRR
jgi:hypothetical protein